MLTRVVALFLVAASLPARAVERPMALQRGVALGLFSEDPGWSYRPLLEEIAQTGADHVALVVAWYLDDVQSTSVHDHPRFTAPPSTIERAIRDAHAVGLRVLIFPIVRLERAGKDEWRGTLRPRDRAALFASYRRKLIELARLSARTGVELLSVGSELSTLDEDRAQWVPIVRDVRTVFHGGLTYSGNWDHFQKVSIYDLLDYAGLCAYFKLTDGGTASDEQLVRRWQALRYELAEWRSRVQRPMIFTEVGYLSQRGASAWPWNEGASEPVDLEEQRRAYAAFRAVWSDGALDGVYFWNWYGWGGAHSGGYTPRGKPAADEIRRFFTDRSRQSPASPSPSPSPLPSGGAKSTALH